MDHASALEVRHSIDVTFCHRVLFSENLFELSNPTLLQLLKDPDSRKRSKAIVFIDQGLITAHPRLPQEIQSYFDSYSEWLNLSKAPVILSGGETIKNSSSALGKMIKHLDQEKICRHSYVLAIGGGSLIDTACFAASIVHRGIRQIRVPTTTLAQGDAAIGIKNGVNFRGKKNFLGSFYPPYAVINDATFLSSLDDENWRNGIAEAVKVALIKDPQFFEWIEQMADSLRQRDLETMKVLIRRSAELHLHHIATSGDPLEQGSSRPLDFGHWSAHKLEQLSGFKLSHGSAVAIGIALDVLYCQKYGYLPDSVAHRIIGCLESLGFKLNHPCLSIRNSLGRFDVLFGIEEFREHLGGDLSVTLLTDVGHAFQTHELDQNILTQCIEHLSKVSLIQV